MEFFHLDADKKRQRWLELEATIQAKTPQEYTLKWGELREEFYQEHGYIDIEGLDVEKLKPLKNTYKGKRIFIIGNGPSLNKMPLELLKNEYTFGANRIYLLFDRISWKPTFYTANDWRVVPDIAREINGLTGMTFFFEERFRGILREGDDIFYHAHTPADPNYPEEKHFGYNVGRGLRGAGSVVGTSIQIAYYLGFDPIYLIGCDLGYKVLSTVHQDGDDKFGTGTKLLLTSTKDDDPNHFDNSYFGKGKRWHDPNVKRMIEGHKQCKAAIEAKGRHIFNATVGGELEVYPRIDFHSLFGFKKYSREENASVEETELVSRLWDDTPGRVMVDVGAHFGSSLAHFVKKGWQIYAFEPDSQNREKLINNYGKRKNVQIDSRAVGEIVVSGKAFYSSKESSGISGMLEFRGSHEKAADVDVTTVKETVREHGIEHIDFLKVDVEGYDLAVLKGVPWDKIKPDIVECEFEDQKTNLLGHTYTDIGDFLVDKGYTVYISEWHPIVRYGIKHDWNCLKRYPCELDDPKGWGNFLAFLNDPGTDRIQKALNSVLKYTTKPIDSSKLVEKIANVESTPYDSNVLKSNSNKINKSSLLESLKVKSMSLFRLLQFGKWLLRLLKRNKKGVVFGSIIVLALIIVTVFIPVTTHSLYIWIIAILAVATATLMIAAAFGSEVIRKYEDRERAFRRSLRIEFLNELKKNLKCDNEIRERDITQLIRDLKLQKRVSIENTNKIENFANLEHDFQKHIARLGKVFEEQGYNQITKMQIQFETIERSLTELSDKMKVESDIAFELQKKTSYLYEEFANVTEKMKSTTEQTKCEQIQLQNIDKKLDQIVGSASVFNFGDYQRFNRKLEEEHVEILINDWAKKLNIVLTPKSLAYLAHRICMVESSLHGRLATSIENAVLRVLVAVSVKDKNLNIIEIGALFGVGVAMLYDNTRYRYETVNITAIDPLEGYYGNDAPDLITDEPVNELMFHQNLAMTGIPKSDYTLVKLLSTENAAIEKAKQDPFDVLIIDGDHSYEGVKFDFDNYAYCVKIGGYIIFDDYGAPEWSEITDYVDKVVRLNTDFQFVGASFRSAVFRHIEN